MPSPAPTWGRADYLFRVFFLFAGRKIDLRLSGHIGRNASILFTRAAGSFVGIGPAQRRRHGDGDVAVDLVAGAGAELEHNELPAEHSEIVDGLRPLVALRQHAR